MELPIIVNKTLAIWLPGIFDLTSHKFDSNFFTVGIPIGHPYSTVLRSKPIIFLASTVCDFSHSLTGAFPFAVS